MIPPFEPYENTQVKRSNKKENENLSLFINFINLLRTLESTLEKGKRKEKWGFI